MTDKQKQWLNKRAVKVLMALFTCERYLDVWDKIGVETPEYAIIKNALRSIRDAKSDIQTLANRTNYGTGTD